ncbi:MAG: WS/DGAT domain-containing protein [Solirubrobacterales bacterium]
MPVRAPPPRPGARQLSKRRALRGPPPRPSGGLRRARGSPPPRHRSPFDGTVGARRRIAVRRGSRSHRVHDAARELASATLNDAVLAVVAGSLRRWIERCHGRLDDVRVRVPVSLHHEGDATANRDSFFSAPPAAHHRRPDRAAADDQTRNDRPQARSRRRTDRACSRRWGGVRRSSPRSSSGSKRARAEFAVSVSNVPGPRRPVSVLGAPVEQLYTIAEIGLRHALRVSAVSLADRLFSPSTPTPT